VVIVTHDNRMLGYADRIVQIEDGRVTAAGAAAERAESILEGAVA
jgi:ABC-type lipoprotein export system ATPase subunit